MRAVEAWAVLEAQTPDAVAPKALFPAREFRDANLFLHYPGQSKL
jgi:hypothetical protein